MCLVRDYSKLYADIILRWKISPFIQTVTKQLHMYLMVFKKPLCATMGLLLTIVNLMHRQTFGRITQIQTHAHAFRRSANVCTLCARPAMPSKRNRREGCSRTMGREREALYEIQIALSLFSWSIWPFEITTNLMCFAEPIGLWKGPTLFGAPRPTAGTRELNPSLLNPSLLNPSAHENVSVYPAQPIYKHTHGWAVRFQSYWKSWIWTSLWFCHNTYSISAW